MINMQKTMRRILAVTLMLLMTLSLPVLASAKNMYLLTKISYEDDWRNEKQVSTYKYNSKGLLTKAKVKSSFGWKTTTKYTYKDDRISKYVYEDDDSEWVYTFTYKKNGTLWKEKRDYTYKNGESGTYLTKYVWKSPSKVQVRNWDPEKEEYVPSNTIVFNKFGGVKYDWWAVGEEPLYPRTWDKNGFTTSDYENGNYRKWTNTFEKGRLTKTVLEYSYGIYPDRGKPVVTYTYKKVNVPNDLIERVTLQQGSLLSSGRPLPLC